MRGMDLVSPFYMWVQFFCASWEWGCLFPSVCFLIFAQISCGSLYFFIYSVLLLLAWFCNRTKYGSKTDIGLFAGDYFGCLRFWAYQWEVEFLFLFWWNVIGIFWWGQQHCCAASLLCSFIFTAQSFSQHQWDQFRVGLVCFHLLFLSSMF